MTQANEHYNPSAKERFWLAVGAQGAGILLLLSIGNVFPAGQTDLSTGLDWIHIMGFLGLGALVVGFLSSLVAKRWCQEAHSCVDSTIITFLLFDIPIVLFLVCQQGGLSRSMFVPLFFLIPGAHLAVERRQNRYRVYIGVGLIALCLMVSCMVSRNTPLNLPTNVGQSDPTLRVYGSLATRITDFSILAPKRFALATLIVSLIALLIPMTQWGIVGFIASDAKKEEPPGPLEGRGQNQRAIGRLA